MTPIASRLCASLAFCVSILGATVSSNAAYPDRTVHLVVGFAPGGGTDAVARMVAQKLSAKWGQPVVVDNKPGAESTIAGDLVAHSPADGYTILMSTNTDTIPRDFKVNYDLVKSFVPVISLVSKPALLVVNPSVPANSLKELVALAKAKPGQLNFGSTGTGTTPYMQMALLTSQTGMNLVNVVYKGDGPIVVALMGNEIQLAFETSSAVMPQVKAGQLRALAISTKVRSPAVPDVPTVAEAANLPDYDVGSWTGFLAPVGTPADIVKKLHDDSNDAMKLPDVQKFMADQGFIITAGSSADFGKTIATDKAKWASLQQGIQDKK